MSERSDVIVGIDLGTTNSLIGTVVDGAAVLFPDSDGNELMPSVVGSTPTGIVVGRAAKNRRALDPQGTVVSVKRRMGQDARVDVGTREMLPQEVSALILSALLDRAERAIGTRPGRAVITVPAYFDDRQRQATRDAGEIAGLAVERLVNEPTAAAMTYQSGGEERVLVYDLGGGTFDVSVLERDTGFLEVKASRGDTRLGGDDIDFALVKLVVERLGAGGPRVLRDPAANVRLLEAVERAKVALSSAREARLVDPFLVGSGEGAVHLDMVLTREDVELAARPFIERTLAAIDEALRDARVAPRELDRVLLVGGASKMPIVQATIEAHLGRPALLDAEADRAVALGASLLAGRAAGAAVSEVLVDITPHTLAVGVAPGRFALDEDEMLASPVIPRDTVIPVTRTETYFTRADDVDHLEIPVVQGEEHLADDNTQLGQFRVEGLPPSPQGSPVDVTFRLDLSGVLHVAAVHRPSGKAGSITITNAPSRLTAHKRKQAQRLVSELRGGAPLEPAAEAGSGAGPDSSALASARAMLARAERTLAKTEAGAPRERVEAAAANVRDALASRAVSPGLVDELSDALLDLL